MNNKKMTFLLAFFIFLMGLTTSIVSQDLENGLIGYWSLNEGSDTITADISGNGFDGIINVETNWVEGKFGSALKFDEDDYVNLGNDGYFELGASDFTISAWIKTPGPSDQATIFAKGGDGKFGIRYHLIIQDSVMRIIMDNDDPPVGDGKKDPMGDIKVCDNEWHLIVGYRDGGTLRVYVDGLEDEVLSARDRATFDPSYSVVNTIHGAYIGAITENGDPAFPLVKFFQGVIDDVALWDRALTLSEIDYLWNNGDGNPVIEVPSAVADLEQNAFGLLENYPNPFNSLTTFSFELPENSDTKLTVYNSLGQEVAVLVDGMRLAGIHKAQFDGSELPDGVYFAKFHTGLYSKTIKMLLTK